MGTWCPNCHDEAPVLRDLYARYRGQGLEVVALTWEYTDDVERSRRLVAQFVAPARRELPDPLRRDDEDGRRVGAAGAAGRLRGLPDDALPRPEHRIVRVHSGFDGPATGERYAQLKKEIEGDGEEAPENDELGVWEMLREGYRYSGTSQEGNRRSQARESRPLARSSRRLPWRG